jgi:hypothetical protein
MVTPQVLEEVLTISEAVGVAKRLGHPLARNNLVRYAQEGRLAARKSGGTWLTTRASLRDLVVSLEVETRGRPRKLRLSPKRVVHYTRTPELVSTLAEIQQLRADLRKQALPSEQEAQLWEELTTAAVYHTTHLEGNELTFAEAQTIIDEYRQTRKNQAPHDVPQP